MQRVFAVRDMLCSEGWTTRPKIAAELGVESVGYPIVSARGKGLRLEDDFGEGQLLLTDELSAIALHSAPP